MLRSSAPFVIHASTDSGEFAISVEKIGHTNGMKTAVSIPDSLFFEAEGFAARFGKSRSQIYREALSEYLAHRDPQLVTSAMDKVLSEVDSTPDQWLSQASRQMLERIEW